MIDTQIMAGLQNGTAFFASASMFAIGSCFALIGATDRIDAVFRDLPFAFGGGRAAFELKVGGLTALFGYAFFKFGWSYRLFNYCTILFGGLPMNSQINDRAEAERAADQVVKMNVIAAKNFNEGLRAIFLSIGYLGWFVNAYIFMAMTLLVVVILTRRQFFPMRASPFQIPSCLEKPRFSLLPRFSAVDVPPSATPLRTPRRNCLERIIPDVARTGIRAPPAHRPAGHTARRRADRPWQPIISPGISNFFRYIEAGTTAVGWWKMYARGIASTLSLPRRFSLVLAHTPSIRWRPFLLRLR